METNLKKIIDLELPDMSKLPSTEFHKGVEEHSQYVAAVASVKEAMAKAPPTFNQGFEKLIGDCEEKVGSANKSRDLFSHVASECHDILNKFTVCLDGILADSDSSTTSFQNSQHLQFAQRSSSRGGSSRMSLWTRMLWLH